MVSSWLTATQARVRAAYPIQICERKPTSSSRTEDAKLRSADRLANLVALFCIVSWRVMWLTMMARAAPDAPPTIVLTKQEINLLDRLVGGSGNRGANVASLAFYVTKLALLGGYLARLSDPPPGNTVIWRGLRRLADIQLGAELIGAKKVGNRKRSRRDTFEQPWPILTDGAIPRPVTIANEQLRDIHSKSHS